MQLGFIYWLAALVAQSICSAHIFAGLGCFFVPVQVFRYNLNLQYSFTALELEEALAGATGDGGLLADLHMVSVARSAMSREGLKEYGGQDDIMRPV